jgi:hypothetical protein
MIRRPPGCLWINPAKLEISEIKLIDKNVDHTNRIVLANPILKAFGEQRALPSILALNEAPHPTLRKKLRRNHNSRINQAAAFLHNQGQNAKGEAPGDRRGVEGASPLR